MAPYLGQTEDIPVSLVREISSSERKHEQDPLLWEGVDFVDSEPSFIYCLSEAEVTEVRHALKDFLELGLDGGAVSPVNFRLPTLGPVLCRLGAALHIGKGFGVVRGLDPANFSDEDNLVLFLGLSSYIGGLRGKQTDDGSVLSHLHSPLGLTSTQLARPLKYSKRFAEFHNDIGCDIIAMQTRSLAARGGDHLLASIAKIFDHISRTRPDLAEALLTPNWPLNIQRRWCATETRALVFRTDDGRILSSIIPDALLGPPGGTQGASGLPLLTPQQTEALALFQDVATQYQLKLVSQPGDLMFVNNWAVVHGREAFEDDGDQVRYLIRLWLRNEKLAWHLPEPLRIANHMVFDDKTLPEKWNIHRLDNVKFEAYERLAP
ncbi:hypothetical protein QBC41DRAFT_383277 [Cercophora samala]|uniref:TauD/TfdA-like domain-containing protein n=1 Tax=Cercophora samala TaxID=330535 RepID=A0AA40D553_9PEZI|nr:hypothetical protein QBC41DRAFT_383277 [Cercophora samala]